MAEHYQAEGYDPFQEVESGSSLSQKLYALAKPFGLSWKRRLVSRYLPHPGSLLEIGTGTGSFLDTMHKGGWEVQGCEKDDNAARFAREKLHLDVFNGDLSDVKDLKESYDAVTFWHSLEHIHRIKENLSVVKKVIKQDGRLFIALPNPDSCDAAIYANRWVAWDAPRHLWHFKPSAMEGLLRQYGFRLIRCHAMPLDPFYNSLLSEFLHSGGGWWRYPLRFPSVAMLSFIQGIIDSRKGSSVTYVFEPE